MYLLSLLDEVNYLYRYIQKHNSILLKESIHNISHCSFLTQLNKYTTENQSKI